MIWPGVAIALLATVSFSGGSKGQTLRGVEVFVRRGREAALEWVAAAGGGGGGAAVARLGVEEWVVGVMLWCVGGGGAGDQEPGRRCFVYSWQPCCYQNRRSAKRRVRGTRARSFGSQSRASKSHRTILFTARLLQSCRLPSRLFLAAFHYRGISTHGMRSLL